MTSCPEHPELQFAPAGRAEALLLASIHDRLHHGTATAGPAVTATEREHTMDYTEFDRIVTAYDHADPAQFEAMNQALGHYFVRQDEAARLDAAAIADADTRKHIPTVAPEGTHLPEWDHDYVAETAVEDGHGYDCTP